MNFSTSSHLLVAIRGDADEHLLENRSNSYKKVKRSITKVPKRYDLSSE